MSKGSLVTPPAQGWAPQNAPQGGNGGGLARAVRFVRNASLQAGATVVALYAAEIALPVNYKPTTVIGHFYGSIDANDLTAKTAATVKLTREQTEASAREQAKVQWEAEVLRQQMATLHESMTAESDMANTADWVCVIGKIVGQADNADARQFGGAMASACGAGDALRARQQQEYAELSRRYEALISRSGNTDTLNSGN